MEVKTKKRFLGDDRKYLVENGKMICKPEFDDIFIYEMHNMVFVKFVVDHGSFKGTTWPISKVNAMNGVFGIKELKQNNDMQVYHYDNFTVTYNRKNSHIVVYDAKGDIEFHDEGTSFTHTDTSIRYLGSDNQAKAIVLNGEEMKKFEASSDDFMFLEPSEFCRCSEYGWNEESLQAELNFIQAITKNDLKSWNRFTCKNIAVENDIEYYRVSLSDENALSNAKAVIEIVRKKVSSIKAKIADTKKRDKKTQDRQIEIEAFCEQIDSETFGA